MVLAQSSSFWNEVVTLHTLWSPGAPRLPAKGSLSDCGPGGSSEIRGEQRLFEVEKELGIPLKNCSAVDAEDGLGCGLMGV